MIDDAFGIINFFSFHGFFISLNHVKSCQYFDGQRMAPTNCLIGVSSLPFGRMLQCLCNCAPISGVGCGNVTRFRGSGGDLEL